MDRVRTVGKYLLAAALLVATYHLTGGVDLPRGVDPAWLIGGVTVFLGATVVLTAVWDRYLRATGTTIPWSRLYPANQAAGFTSLFLPSPAPSLTRPVFLHDEAPIEAILGSTVVERVNVLAVYGLALLLVAAPIATISPALSLLPTAAGAVLLALAIALRAALRRERADGDDPGWSRRLLHRLGGLASRSAATIDATLDDARTVLHGSRDHDLGLLLQVVAIVGIQGLLGIVVARALGMEIPLLVAWLVPPAAYALAVLPVLPRGLGAVEGAGTWLMTALGTSPGPALAFFLLYRGVTYIVLVGVGGFAFFSAGVDLLDVLQDRVRS